VSPLIAILILLLLAAVVAVVSAPLRQRHSHETAYTCEQLQAAREAKYREIRDSELDFRTGKLSAEDHAAIDAQLRAEAIEILNRLQGIERSPTESGDARSRPGALEQQDRVEEEQHREEDRPAV
jgi:hypothetical protein